MKCIVGIIALIIGAAAFGGTDAEKIKKDASTYKEGKMQRFDRIIFDLEGCEAWLVEPKTPSADGRWVFSSTLHNSRYDDYSTLESIRRTGGLVPDEHWEENRKYATLGLGAVPNEKIVKATWKAGYNDWYTLENAVMTGTRSKTPLATRTSTRFARSRC